MPHSGPTARLSSTPVDKICQYVGRTLSFSLTGVTPVGYHSKYEAIYYRPVTVAARSKKSVWGYSLAAIAGSNPAGGMMPVVSVVCYQVEGSTTG